MDLGDSWEWADSPRYPEKYSALGIRIGVNDRFSEHCGSYDYLLKEHGLDHASIEARILRLLAEG